MKIWRCPRCDTGKKAPSKLAHLDVRRWCLACSAETGKLVEMVCPSLERARVQAKEKQNEKARKKTAKAREAFCLETGLNMREVIKKAKKLKVWSEQCGVRGARSVLACPVRLLIGEPGSAHGRAGAFKAHVHLRKDSEPFYAILIVIHELTHVAMDASGMTRPTGARKKRWHDTNFHSILLEASCEWWPELKGHLNDLRVIYRLKGGKDKAYSMDRAIEGTLKNLYPEIQERFELTTAREAERVEAKWAAAKARIEKAKHKADCTYVLTKGGEPCSCK